MATKATKNSIDDHFKLPDDYLHSPVTDGLRPGMITATRRSDGRDCVLKIWWKTRTKADAELKELWRHERLQVDRIMNYPGADEVMVGVIDMMETVDAFCVVNEPSAIPLAAKLRTATQRNWIRALDIPSNRIVLWKNFSRLATALGILHARNLVHGRVDAYSVFTEGSQSADFRLGGFEWSLVLAQSRPLELPLQQVREKIDRIVYSYSEDWKNLGILFAELIGLEPKKLREDDPFKQGSHTHDLIRSEIDFLRRVIDPVREEVVDTKLISQNIELIIRELTRSVDTRSARFLLLFRPNQKMEEAIYTATNGSIAVGDFEEQFSFLEGDLAGGVKIVEADTTDFMFIFTETFRYGIQKNLRDNDADWQSAYINSIALRSEVRLPTERDFYQLNHPVLLFRNKQAIDDAIDKMRKDALPWTMALPSISEETTDNETSILRNAFLLLQVIDALLKSLQIFPVEVSDWRSEPGHTIIQLSPQMSSVRDTVALAIGERTTSEELDRLFDKDDVGVDIEWSISTSGGLTSHTTSEVSARFITVNRSEDGRPAYEFEVAELPPESEVLFLRTRGDQGTESLIRRKLRTSQALEDQRDLVSLFFDPRKRQKSSGEIIEKDEFYLALDPHKRDAIDALWSTTPSYFVVGPPGVGKTRLVREVIRRKLQSEPSTRILVSAQSHQALDNILNTVRKEFELNADAILVRSRGNDDAISTETDVRNTALSYLRRASQSNLAKEALAPIQKTLLALETVLKDDLSPNRREAESITALNSLVLESANVVFSTSTSKDIERLVEDGGQFDWVVIEEAAKASGPDLVAPLALSGRRLFIGDHNQLPPFDADRFKKILHNKKAVQQVLIEADKAISSTFFDADLQALASKLENEDSLQQITSVALRTLEPFSSLVQEDSTRPEFIAGKRRAVTSELLLQHRMDPAIAELVSRCFYSGRLLTGDERIEQAKVELPFEMSAGFPVSPIVFVNTEYVSRTGRGEEVERTRPRWHNPSEVKIVIQLLEKLQSNAAKRPTLAVLSPYKAQVDRLNRQIQTAKHSKPNFLKGIDGFAHDDRICGTVDSSQGSEADLVIVSLVRNNSRTGVSALGFLSDPRRMNVLLSRARKQLIIVGSLEFLRESTRYRRAELSFVSEFLSTLEALTNEPSLRGVPKATIVDASRLVLGAA